MQSNIISISSYRPDPAVIAQLGAVKADFFKAASTPPGTDALTLWQEESLSAWRPNDGTVRGEYAGYAQELDHAITLIETGRVPTARDKLAKLVDRFVASAEACYGSPESFGHNDDPSAKAARLYNNRKQVIQALHGLAPAVQS